MMGFLEWEGSFEKLKIKTEDGAFTCGRDTVRIQHGQ